MPKKAKRVTWHEDVESNSTRLVNKVQNYLKQFQEKPHWFLKPFRWLRDKLAPVTRLKNKVRQQFIKDIESLKSIDDIRTVADTLTQKLEGLYQAQVLIETQRTKKYQGKDILECAAALINHPEKHTIPQMKRLKFNAKAGVRHEEVRLLNTQAIVQKYRKP